MKVLNQTCVVCLPFSWPDCCVMIKFCVGCVVYLADRSSPRGVWIAFGVDLGGRSVDFCENDGVVDVDERVAAA